MVENRIRQIIIDNRLIGLVGLDDAIKKIAKNHNILRDDEIQRHLLEMISVNNYIPAAAEGAYASAILREFKIAQGSPAEPETLCGLRIDVLGMGCPRCNQLESDIRDILSEMKIAADLRHITDPKEISSYGVMGSPALVINNKVLSVGDIPPKSRISRWIMETNNPHDNTDK
jgi:hypothetical protein